jgi:hypothetical protein
MIQDATIQDLSVSRLQFKISISEAREVMQKHRARDVLRKGDG